MNRTDRDWRLIREEPRPGAFQMALDEVAAETAAAGGPRTLRVYRWEPSCLTLGYNQDPDTVDWAFCDREGIDVTRRPTGGGGIYHDNRGDIAYSIALPADEAPGALLDAYHLLCEPVLGAFDRLGLDVDYVEEQRPAIYHPACYLRALHPAHDMIAGDRKIAGNAQYRRREAIVQHGSLSFETDAARHLGAFSDPGVGPADFRERVTGIADLADVSRGDAVAALEASLREWADAREAGWTDAELAEARDRVEEKFDAEGWVRRRPGDR